MKDLLSILQLLVSILLAVLILLQKGGSSLGGAFGQSGEFYITRRGLHKKIFWATVISGGIFIVLAILNLKF